MFTKIQKFQGDNPDVWKYVFEKDDICVEAVLYRYESFEKRTVLCVSVQSGCPVGCVFCGTGRRFIRNLTSQEIVDQATYIIDTIENQNNIKLNSRCEKLQIMFMSMGEPMLNWNNVRESIVLLNSFYPNAELLISTVGIDDDEVFGELIRTSIAIPKVGLQFSLHSTSNVARDEIIPFKNKMSLHKLRDAGLMWNMATGRKVFLNVCIGHNNFFGVERARCKDLFSPLAFALTFSAICEYEDGKVKDEDTKKLVAYRCEIIMREFLSEGYNVRKFDPAGQDDIGAGCGQLWYVQQWMRGKHEVLSKGSQ